MMPLVAQFELQPLFFQLQCSLQQSQQTTDYYFLYIQLQKGLQLMNNIFQLVASNSNRFGSKLPYTLICKMFTYLSRDDLGRGERVNRHWHAALNSTSRRLLLPYSAKPPGKYTYLRESQAGDTLAQAKLAFCYQSGYGTTPDGKAAFQWAKMSARYGDPEGQAALGCCYLYGQGIKRDYSEAVKLIQLSVSKLNARGQFLLALCYENGLGVLCDKAESRRLLLQAVDQGYPPALVEMGIRYFDGNDVGVGQDQEKGIRLLKLAAELGQPEAQCKLGEMYYMGKKVPKDPDLAFQYFQSSAYLGMRKAQSFLAICYGDGEIVPKDERQFLRWATAAARSGEPVAQYALGEFFENKGNRERALDWYKVSAEQGVKQAQNALERLRSYRYFFD